MTTRSNLTVTIVRDPDQLAGLQDDWQQLHERSQADLFLSSNWLVPWWRHLAGKRELFVLLAHDCQGHLRGLLALSRETARVGFRRVRRLRFLGDDHVSSDYLDALIEPDWTRPVNQAFAASLLARASDWDVIELRDMDKQSTTGHQLLAGLGPAFDMRSENGLLCPLETFEPELALDDFMRQTRRFQNYARRRKWLERQPGFKIDVCQAPAGLPVALDHFFRLHRLRWHKEGGSSGIVGPRVEAFHREAMSQLMAAGQLRLYTLWVAEHAVASVYAMVHDGVFYYYQAGMDPAWRARSVGLVLIGQTFADAIHSGLTRYDFLRGEEAYKGDWVGNSRQLISRRLFARHGPGAKAVREDSCLTRSRRLIKQWIRRHVGQRTVTTRAMPQAVGSDGC